MFTFQKNEYAIFTNTSDIFMPLIGQWLIISYGSVLLAEEFVFPSYL